MTDPDELDALRGASVLPSIRRLQELVEASPPAFLLGAGCSRAAGLPLTQQLTNEVLTSGGPSAASKRILEATAKLFESAGSANIEDYISEMIDFLSIADRRDTEVGSEGKISAPGGSYSAAELRLAVEETKSAIASVIDRKLTLETHKAFVAAVHAPLRPGKGVARGCVDYLVLNYDTAIEDSLAAERVPFADGLEGGVTAWWQQDTFSRSDIGARVLKLHGSIDWVGDEQSGLPRREARDRDIGGSARRNVMIWPASTKYRETQLDPFAQLLQRARKALRPAEGEQRVLVTCGYSFGDAHINSEIEKALRDSRGELTLAAFTELQEPEGPLLEWSDDPDIREQVLIFANGGFFHADVSDRSTTGLNWWKFEILTRLLAGEL
jgi:hypothetical protein